MIENRILEYSDKFLTEFNETDVFVIEIPSKTSYEHNGRFVHQVLHERNIKSDIIIRELSDEEIEEDIIKMREELNNKPFIIVSHISTIDDDNKRNQLVVLLEKICTKHHIPFIHPMKELTKRGHNIHQLVMPEYRLNHYNDAGHDKISEVYDDFIHQIMKALAEAKL